MSAGTSVSGTKRPPNSPKRPRPTGSGPGGSRRTGSPRAGAVIGSCVRVTRRRPSSRTARRRGRAPSRRRRAARPPSRASSTNRRSLRASLRPEPGVVSTPVATSTPHGRTRRIACATFSPLRPPARSRRTPGGHRVGERPVERGARPGVVGVDQHDVDRTVADRGERGIAGGEGLDHERHPLADPAHVGQRLAAVELRAAEAERVDDLDDPLLGLVAEHADGDHTGREAVEDLARPSPGVTWRGLPGANTKPSASAPRATARSASSSLVTPQILIEHRARGYRTPRVTRVHSRPDGRRGVAGGNGASATGCPIVLILVAYLVLHELATTLDAARARASRSSGSTSGSSAAPRRRSACRRELWNPGDPQLVRLPRVARVPQPLRGDARRSAIVLWVRAYPLFRRFRALFLTVTFAGFVTYVLYPAIPPWLASRRGDMPHTVRIVRAMWLELGLSDVAAVFGEKSQYAFPVGALPSLHAAWPFLLLVFFWPVAGRWRAAARRVHARDGVHPRVHRRPLRVRHPPRLDLRDRRGARRFRVLGIPRTGVADAASDRGRFDADGSGVDEAAVEVVVVGGRGRGSRGRSS